MASFPNVTYLLAFDRDIVTKALATIQEGDGNDYLGKIIQVPFELPAPSQAKVNEVFLQKLQNILDESPHFENEDWTDIFYFCVEPYLPDLRAVNRIINTLKLKYNLLHGNVFFPDLVVLCVLQIYEPELYNWIKENKMLLLKNYEDIVKYSFNPPLFGDNSSQAMAEQTIKQIKTVSKKSISITHEIMCRLFPEYGETTKSKHRNINEKELHKEQRIACEQRFDCYFSLTLDEYSISRQKTQYFALTADEQEMHEMIHHINMSNNGYYLISELSSFYEDIPQNRIPLIIKVLAEECYYLTGEDKASPLSISGTSICRYLIGSFLERYADENERYKAFVELIKTVSDKGLATCAFIINGIELSYGRWGTENKTAEKKMLSIEHLELIEQTLIERIQETASKLEVSELTLLEYNGAGDLIYVWQKLDKDNAAAYMQKVLMLPLNVAKFIAYNAIRWRGSNVTWDFQKENIKLYISLEKALEIISSLKQSVDFMSLAEEIQFVVVAFYLWMNTKDKYRMTIDQKMVDAELLEWII